MRGNHAVLAEEKTQESKHCEWTHVVSPLAQADERVTSLRPEQPLAGMMRGARDESETNAIDNIPPQASITSVYRPIHIHTHTHTQCGVWHLIGIGPTRAISIQKLSVGERRRRKILPRLCLSSSNNVVYTGLYTVVILRFVHILEER